MSDFYWRNKVAIITGASQGIGARIAINLANAGMVVVGLSRRPELIQNLNDELTGTGKIYSHCCDLRSQQDISDTFKWIRSKFSHIHVLICNAGMVKAKMLLDLHSDEFKEIFDLNLVATTSCLREGLKQMQNSKQRGHIIVINSMLGHQIPQVPQPLFNVYPATKYALTALCQTTRQEIRYLNLNIKLTSISPGMVDTEFLNVYNKRSLAGLPKLHADDVAKAVYYALDCSEDCEVEDILLQAKPHYENSTAAN